MSENERDVLAAVIRKNFNDCRGRNGVSPTALADAILAAGFRRSEVPTARMIDTYTDRDLRQAFGLPEPQGAPSDALSEDRIRFAESLADPNFSLSVPEQVKSVIRDLLADLRAAGRVDV